MGEYIRDDDGQVYSAAQWLDKLGWSAHILATPSGELIRCRDDNETAWHAKGHNVNSLGVEFLVAGEHDYGSFLSAIKTDYVTELQYNAGIHMVKEWVDKWNIGIITRHSAIDPDRKQDPGTGFPWAQFLGDL